MDLPEPDTPAAAPARAAAQAKAAAAAKQAAQAEAVAEVTTAAHAQAVARSKAAAQAVAEVSPAPRAKAELRRRLLAARASLQPSPESLGSAPSADSSGRALLAVARTLPQVVAARTVALYVAMPPEPETGPLIDWLVASGKQVLLPILLDDNDLGWGVAPPDRTALVSGRLGLRQPAADLGRDAIARAELVICPALAVDRTGVRLGRGGGSYDRALARVKPGVQVWAVVYDSELVDTLPADRHDHLVQAALTPTRLTVLAAD